MPKLAITQLDKRFGGTAAPGHVTGQAALGDSRDHQVVPAEARGGPAPHEHCEVGDKGALAIDPHAVAAVTG